MQWSRVNRSQWAKTRTLVLTRDAHTCRMRLPGCTLTATEVDHIIPISQGGAVYDENNCRAVCTTCHDKRSGSTIPTTTLRVEHW